MNGVNRIPNAKVINFTIYRDGVQIEKSSGKDQLLRYQDDTDVGLFRAILDGVISR